MTDYGKKLVIFFCLLVLGAMVTYAQVIPTGKLVGHIKDGEGLVLQGATVTISSPSLILPEMSDVTNEKGYYRFVELPSGVYKVKIEMSGMKTIIRENIIITVGQTMTLNISMSQTAIQEEINVVGQAPMIDLQSSTIGVTYKTELISSLPIQQRSFEGIYNLAPGIYDSASHGSDIRSNKYTVDGMSSKEPGEGLVGPQIGFESIEEVMVDTGGHKAEYGNVRGAVVQVITKSGGNNFSGEINTFFRHQELQSDNTKGTPFEGRFVGFDHSFEPGISIGGAIIKDRIWFFTSFNYRRQDSYIDGYPALADQNVPVNNDYYTPFAKLTWQINPNNKLVLSGWFRKDWTDHHRASRLYTAEGSLHLNNKINFLSGQWQKFFSKNLIFTIRAGYYKNESYDGGKNLSASLVHQLPSGITTNWGRETFINFSRYQANTVGTYFVEQWAGTHEFKIGADFELVKWHNWDIKHQEERFVDAYEPGFFMYRLWYSNGDPYRALFSTEIDRRTESLTYGGFIQDTWNPAKFLTINLGLRFDHMEGRYPRQLLAGSTTEYAIEQTEKPINWNTIAPRVSLSFDPFLDGKTVIRAGYGRYYAPLNLYAFSFGMKSGTRSFWIMFNSDWSENYRYGWSTTKSIEWDRDTKAPYSDEINFGIQRELFPDITLGVTYVQKWEKLLLERLDSNALDVDLFKNTGELNWIGYDVVEGTDPLTGDPVQFWSQKPDKKPTAYYHTNVPGTARDYKGLEIKLTKRMSNNWAMMSSYVYSKGMGIIGTGYADTSATTFLYANPNFTVLRQGLLDHQRQHHFKTQVTYLAPLGFLISGYFQYFSGEPFTRTIRNLEAGVNVRQGTATRYAETRGSSKTPGNFLLDLRVEKQFDIGPGSLRLMADVFNVFNSNEIVHYGARTGLDYMDPISITDPRYIRLGIAYRF